MQRNVVLSVFFQMAFSFLTIISLKSPSLQSFHGQKNMKFTLSSLGEDDLVPQEDVFGAAIGTLPTVSSKTNFPKENFNIHTDLWIVGAGTLGSIVAQKWKEQFPTSKIIAETQTSRRHAEFTSQGIQGQTRDERSGNITTDRCAKNVLICFPPSSTGGIQDLFAELAEACRLWAGPLGGGKLLYTSSTAVYGESHGNTVTETFR